MTGRPAVVCALLFLGVVACSLPEDANGLAGTYVMHQDSHADTVVLHADGRWVRRFRADEHSGILTDSGTWFVSKNRKLVALRNFPKRWRWVHDCRGRSDGTCPAIVEPLTLTLEIERSWYGKFRLGWHSSFGWWYDRIAKPETS